MKSTYLKWEQPYSRKVESFLGLNIHGLNRAVVSHELVSVIWYTFFYLHKTFTRLSFDKRNKQKRKERRSVGGIVKCHYLTHKSSITKRDNGTTGSKSFYIIRFDSGFVRYTDPVNRPEIWTIVMMRITRSVYCFIQFTS